MGFNSGFKGLSCYQNGLSSLTPSGIVLQMATICWNSRAAFNGVTIYYLLSETEGTLLIGQRLLFLWPGYLEEK